MTEARSNRRVVLPPEAAELITPADRLAISVIVLGPCLRRTLEAVASAGRLVTSGEIAATTGRDKGTIHDEMVKLWTRGLISRSGSQRTARYAINPAVPALLGRFASVGRRNSNYRPDQGLSVLGLARLIAVDSTWPSFYAIREVSTVPVDKELFARWRRILRASGLWPDESRLDRWGRARAVNRSRPIGAAKARDRRSRGRRRFSRDVPRSGPRVRHVDAAVLDEVVGAEIAEW